MEGRLIGTHTRALYIYLILLYFLTHLTFSFKYVIIYLNVTSISAKRVYFILNPIDLVCAICAFLRKYSIFSKSYCTVLLKKFDHFDKHNCFFGFFLRFKNTAVFFFFIDFEVKLHDAIPYFTMLDHRKVFFQDRLCRCTE